MSAQCSCFFSAFFESANYMHIQCIINARVFRTRAATSIGDSLAYSSQCSLMIAYQDFPLCGSSQLLHEEGHNYISAHHGSRARVLIEVNLLWKGTQLRIWWEAPLFVPTHSECGGGTPFACSATLEQLHQQM